MVFNMMQYMNQSCISNQRHHLPTFTLRNPYPRAASSTYSISMFIDAVITYRNTYKEIKSLQLCIHLLTGIGVITSLLVPNTPTIVQGETGANRWFVRGTMNFLLLEYSVNKCVIIPNSIRGEPACHVCCCLRVSRFQFNI